jgi:HPt (histidine-containing phosphotransfer) domain-containing protein
MAVRNDLHAAFVPRFAKSARTRLTRALADIHNHVHAETPRTVSDLHTIAGDAGLLGLRQIAELARSCEDAARSAQKSCDDAELDHLADMLGELSDSIDLLSPRV